MKLTPALVLLAGAFAAQPAAAQTPGATPAQAAPAATFTALSVLPESAFGYSFSNPLTLGADNNFYGTSAAGGAYGYGTAFKVTVGGLATRLYDFGAAPSDGGPPAGPLVPGAPGTFYGVTLYGGHPQGGVIFSLTTGRKYTQAYEFPTNPDGSPTPAGATPWGLTLFKGTYYGVTLAGGRAGGGIAFSWTPQHKPTVLHDFSGGADPYRAPVPGPDGALYGVTLYEGANHYGEVYRLTTSGAFQVLHSFAGSDGAVPLGLTSGPGGALYGVTNRGGYGSPTRHGPAGGTLFKITPAGHFTLLFKFRKPDGLSPNGPLALGSDGRLYGATAGDGTTGTSTIFSLTPAGALSTLYRFRGGADGDMVLTPAIFGPDGALYGIANTGNVFFRLALP